MIGKFLRFAFMDKATREKWEATQAAKSPRGKGATAAASNKGRGKAAAETPAAPRTSAPASAEGGASDAPQGEAAIRAAIAEAVAAAEREMLEEVGLPPDPASRAQQGTPASPARQAPPGAPSMASGDDGSDRAQLIRSALTVHKMKQSALADLDPEQRARLRALAETMMGVASGKAGENSGGGGQDR